MSNKIEKYYINKNNYFLILIFVIGLTIDISPKHKDLPQDANLNDIILHGTAGSTTSVVGVIWRSTELISTPQLDKDGNSYYYVDSKKDN